MKKIITFLITLVLALGLFGCGNDKPPENGNGNGDEPKIDLKGIDFIIMVDNKSSADPRLETYSSLFRDENIAKIEAAEKKYNIKVVYENYPSNASWGAARTRWIVEQAELGVRPAHVFEVNSMFTGSLAAQKAILPLDDLIETYGVKGYWPEKMIFGQVLGKHYLYDSSYPVADDGLYYNSDLLAEVLGPERRNEPTDKWLEGTWTWDAFHDLALELKGKLDHNRSEEEGGPQYVLGGRVYNWVYTMIGSNGASLVDSDFNTHLTDQAVIDTVDFLHNLYAVEGMWIANAPLANASQPEFKAGNVVFHNGHSWHINASNKWGGAEFVIDFVPYPVGPNIKSDKSNYYVNHVYGKAGYAISSAYSKENIPEGYEDMIIHSETIFKIWHDLQYFPKFDEATQLISTEEIYLAFYNTSLRPYYGSKKSMDAHMDVIDLARPEFFYSFEEAQSHDANESYMLELQNAVHHGDSRRILEAIEAKLIAIIQERYFSD